MSIESLIQDYKMSLSKIDERRKEWYDTYRKIVLDAFHEIADVNEDLFYIQENDSHNWGSICLVLRLQKTGIIHEGRHHLRTQGALSVGIMFDGKIGAVMSPAHVEDIQTPLEENKWLEILEPSKITKSLIEDYIKEFLNYSISFVGYDEKNQYHFGFNSQNWTKNEI